jgi:FlaA1/EpsC-like NDP-sugar epimerase
MHSDVVLITGAGGSIGSALSQTLLNTTAAHVVLLDVSEQNLYQLDLNLARIFGRTRFSPVLGDIADDKLIASLIQRRGVKRVFHTAAFKHVSLLENDPFAALKNNALGTWKLASQARNHGVSQFVMLSTDKAVDPVGIMGATKRAAEIALLALDDARTRMLAIRLGNVFGSRGSVVPLFLEQIAHGGPVTVTHPTASRYFFGLNEAVNLILSAAELDLHGIVVPQARSPRNVLELAEDLVASCESPMATEVQIVFTGLRAGEKLCEAFVSAEETMELTGDPRLFAVTSPVPDRHILTEHWSDLLRSVELCEIEPALRALRKIVPNYKPAERNSLGVVGFPSESNNEAKQTLS